MVPECPVGQRAWPVVAPEKGRSGGRVLHLSTVSITDVIFLVMPRRPVPVRERLLDAADNLLFVDGAYATPVDVILREAEASPPSLYSHFGSKQGLIAAALRRRLEIWTRTWDEAIDAAEGARGRLLAVYPALRRYQGVFLTERWCAFTGTTAGITDPGPELAEVLADERRLLSERHEELCAALLGPGPEADALARRLVIAYGGTIVLMLRDPWREAIDDGEATAGALVDAAHVGAPA